MKIQSLSVVVPTHNRCVNKCKFCVSRTHTNPYEDRINIVVTKWKRSKYPLSDKDFDFIKSIEYKDYFNRLQFARDNGCNVVVLTGTGEPIQNPKFIDFFSEVNSTLTTPFKSIEMQTTGVMLDAETLVHLREIGVTTISFSISNIFDNDRNLEIIGCTDKFKFDVFEVIKLVKKYDFNLRLSLNLVNDYDKYSVEQVIERCNELGADQVTFRKLYKSNLNNEIDQWIEDNASEKFYDDLVEYVKKNGRFLGVLPFGPSIYDIKEISMVIDGDCMAEESKDTYKYLILRENAKLYFRWDLKSSLVF
jgi:MoaA/NifB/PqqE/SkfB family radical SAM enzyme